MILVRPRLTVLSAFKKKMNKPLKFGTAKKSQPTTDEAKEEAAPEVPDVDPVVEARDVDEAALDKPHDEEVKEEDTTTDEAKEETTTPPVEEESRDEPSFPETEEKKEETPAEEEDTSIRTEPSGDNDVDAAAADTKPAVEEEKNVDPVPSAVNEEEEPSEEKPVAAAPSKEEKKEKTMNIDTAPVSDEDEPTLETKDTMDENLLKGCVTPVMKATEFCGITIRNCFE